MQISFSEGNIILTLYSHVLKDYNFIKQYRPRQLANNKTQYMMPLTKTSLSNVINYFNLEVTPNLSKTLLQLDTTIHYNFFNNSISNNPLLRPYQEQGVKWINMRLPTAKSLCLFWAMRTGKTRTTCVATKDYKKIIVLSLAGQEANWESTYIETTKRECINLRTYKDRSIAYDKFNKSANAILIGSINTITNDININKNIIDFADILVIDEIHKAKNSATKLYKGCKTLRHTKCTYCLGLTGTPVSKEANEILSLFTLLYPKKFSKTYLKEYFFDIHKAWFSEYGVIGDVSPDKKEEWLEFMSLYFSQVKKEQALAWATEPEKQTVYLKMDPAQRKVYEDCLFYNEVKYSDNEVEQLNNMLTQFLRLQQISTHPALLGIGAPSIKEEWLLEYLQLKEYDGLIIFSTRTSYLKILYEKLIKLKYKVCLITGETKNKTELANEFQQGKYDIVLANIQSGSKGITLDRADTMIFLDEDWKPDENIQAIERFTPTSPDKVKFRKVYRLQIQDTFELNNKIIYSMDKYINDVVNNKISQTQLINNFKEIFKFNFEI